MPDRPDIVLIFIPSTQSRLQDDDGDDDNTNIISMNLGKTILS
jgi:hypothetical protein